MCITHRSRRNVCASGSSAAGQTKDLEHKPTWGKAKGNRLHNISFLSVCMCACVLRLNQLLPTCAANHKKVAQLMMSRYGCH